tara:strand:+ start:2792 stop:3031 length:240 start_codon:yes stop_codon:yes gene_type:complete
MSELSLENKVGAVFYIDSYKLTQINVDEVLIEHYEIKNRRGVICGGDFGSVLSGMLSVTNPTNGQRLTAMEKLKERPDA